MSHRFLICLLLSFGFDLHAATIEGFAGGFANQTSGFWGIEFLSGAAADRIASVTLQMPGPGFFDFSGTGNFQNQTAPIFDAAASSGLTAAEVSFLFTGANPNTLEIVFAPAAFAPGDRLQFAADIDGLGSKLGGALGAFGGVQMTVTLADGSIGMANFRTDTSVFSFATLNIGAAEVPDELSSGPLLLCALTILCLLKSLAPSEANPGARRLTRPGIAILSS